MKRKKLFWQLYPSLLFISLSTLLGLIVITQYTFKKFFYEQTSNSLEEKAHVLKNEYYELIKSHNYVELQRKVTLTSKDVNNRITIILPGGKVVADSGMSPELLESHKERFEIKEALAGRVGKSKRFSSTLEEDYFYLAVPVYRAGKIVAVLRNSVPVVRLKEKLSGITRQIIGIGILLIIVLGGVNWWVSEKISTPLEIIKNYADSFTEEEIKGIPMSDSDVSVEIESLVLAFNKMGRRINKQFKKIFNQKEEREAVFNSMVEGVLSVNLEGEIFHWNRAACELFDVQRENLQKGVPLIEAFHNEKLVDYFKQSLDEQKVLEEELTLPNSKVLQCHGTPLYTAQKEKMGVLFVFNEITKIRKLETHRKEFVANVSHELRTPLTAIQGFVETLMEGEIDEESRQKFLAIIQRHTSRLGLIIEDLLALSHIERDSEQKSISFIKSPLDKVVKLSIDNCERKAKAKNITLGSDIESEGIEYAVNSHLMEQAITNLVDNAIKYSPSKTHIDVKLFQDMENVHIHVVDQGPGIDEVHHQRLFERFYSVDKARSREMGGSGLGLSIVKHIVKAHGGDISIQSEVGKGSIFKIALPV